MILIWINFQYLFLFNMTEFNSYINNMKALDKIYTNNTYWELLYDDKITTIKMNLTHSVNYTFYFCTRDEIDYLKAYEQTELDKKVEKA